NIDAAHETDAAVDHAGLAMHAAQPAQVEVRPPQTPGLRAIDAMPDTGLGKAVTYVVSGFAAAEAIEHHPHLDTALFGARQGVDDAQAGVVEIEDVGFKMHRLFGGIDRPNERRKEFAAVAQQPDRIALAPFELKPRRHE